jgi:hypothetical protein
MALRQAGMFRDEQVRALMFRDVQVQVAKVPAVQMVALRVTVGMFPGGSQEDVVKLALSPPADYCRACRYFLFLACLRMAAMCRGLSRACLFPDAGLLAVR